MKAIRRLKPVLVGATLLAVALATLPLTSGRALASLSTCRTDPAVTLSNGYTIVMDANIQDTIPDVKNVHYTLHIPAGVTVTGVSYDQYGYLETLTVVADQPPGQGYTDTVVTTGLVSVPVTADSAIQGVVAGSVTGYSGQHLDLYYGS